MNYGLRVVLLQKSSIGHMCLDVLSMFLMLPCRMATKSQNGFHGLVLVGVFLGFSSLHSSQVPLVMNMESGKISPQFHVIFDDKFETVLPLTPEESIGDQWKLILCL